MGPLPEEDASIKRQVNRLHKSRPSDLSYMKRRHHLEWHRIRKYGSPNRRRRRDRFHSLKVVVAGTIGPAGATFVDPFEGSFVSNPSFMKMAIGGHVLQKPQDSKVVGPLPEEDASIKDKSIGCTNRA